MYNAFFGLTSQPFSIAPNPEFMFLGNRHSEALAHLRYGLGDAGGFVLLTGEVGTGKTTVSRCLLAELPANTQVAFILNPTLSELELLAAICDELKIRYKKTDASLKNLTDKITAKLSKNHQAGVNTILIIDEAQHLQPAVLEQLRLLTNLETNTKKLLQVILIGQPELQHLLQRQDLRQLAQRITARYHLMPLTMDEVRLYVQHRLQVAGCQRPVFNDAALKALFRFSGGIPRLLNLLCDRAMLGAYSQQRALVDARLVELAAGETLAIQTPAGGASRPLWWWPLWFGLAVVAGVVLAYGWFSHGVNG
jgi:general secretion pathway protein A